MEPTESESKEQTLEEQEHETTEVVDERKERDADSSKITSEMMKK